MSRWFWVFLICLSVLTLTARVSRAAREPIADPEESQVEPLSPPTPLIPGDFEEEEEDETMFA